MTSHTLRSRNWFGRTDLDGFVHRSWLKAEGFSDVVFDGRPVIGIANSWSELTNCNAHLRQVAEAVKRGVLSAGGFPLEFPTISLGENLMKPTAMLFRNLMAMDVEECIRAYPLDAVVLIGGCDKTVPAQLMGAASADVDPNQKAAMARTRVTRVRARVTNRTSAVPSYSTADHSSRD